MASGALAIGGGIGSAGSGAGGGGYYGGGGGQYAGTSGAGGSSFIGTVLNASTTGGLNSSDGYIIITRLNTIKNKRRFSTIF